MVGVSQVRFCAGSIGTAPDLWYNCGQYVRHDWVSTRCRRCEKMDSSEIALQLAVAIIEKMPITRADASPKSTGEAVGELYLTTLQRVVQGLKEAGLQKSA